MPADRFGFVVAGRRRYGPRPVASVPVSVAAAMTLLALAVSPALCALGAVQVLGVVTAGIARLVEGTRHERAGHVLCIGGLAVIGATCGAAVRLGPDAAASCAVTLAIMTLIAVCDLRPPRD